MKLLGWMHRKLRQNNNDVFKEFTSNGAAGGTCNSIAGLGSPDAVTFLQASANNYFSNDAFDSNNHPSLPESSTDLFTFGGSGLLTIGTLGIAAVAVPEEGEEDEEDDYCDLDVHANKQDVEEQPDDVDGPVTPTFTYPPQPEHAAVDTKAVVTVEAIAEKDDDTTREEDLMLVSAELEKVLGGRNSGAAGDLVASARASFATGVDCPLQSFLFGSPVSDAESRQDRRDSVGGGRRTSLGELFMRTRFADDKVGLVAVKECEDGNKVDGGEEGGAAGKGSGGGGKLRKAKDEKSAGGDGAPASATTKSKFQKLLQIFHRKVYPESSALARSLTKKHRKRGGADVDEPKLHCRKEPLLPGFGCCARSSFGGGAVSPDVVEDVKHNNGSKSDHWIRTDAEYLVLEL